MVKQNEYMKYLKTYKTYFESLQIDLLYQGVEDLMESLNIWYDNLLESIDAEKIDIFETLKLPFDEYSNRLDLDFLSKNTEFINSLTSLGLKKSTVNNTADYETFLDTPCKFMFIYDINANELQNPDYLLIQIWDNNIKKWSDCALYKVNDDVNNFYEKLTSKTIEIIDNGENYIYSTTNGNEWNLESDKNPTDVYKKTFRKEELKNFLSNKKIKIKIF